MITNKETMVNQINLFNFVSRMMFLYTLSRGLSTMLPMGLDLTKFGMLRGWSTNLLR